MARLKLCFGMFAITCRTISHPHWPGTKSEGKTNKQTIDLHSGKTGNFIWKGLFRDSKRQPTFTGRKNILYFAYFFLFFFTRPAQFSPVMAQGMVSFAWAGGSLYFCIIILMPMLVTISKEYQI